MRKSLAYRVRHVDLLTDAFGPVGLHVTGFLHYGLRGLLNPIRRRRIRRDQEFVRGVYDQGWRDEEWKETDQLTYDEFVFDDCETRRIVLLEDRFVWSSYADARRATLEIVANRLREELSRVPDQSPTVVEFGSGSGRNLLYFKRMFPHVRFVGVELSPRSVALSERMAKKFGVEAEFHAADATGEIPRLPENTAVAMSIHALEQMPRIFPRAVQNMAAAASHAILFYEPVFELYPKTPRGRASRWRLDTADYLDGLLNYLRSERYEVPVARRLGIGAEPFNETCEVVVRLS